MKLNPLQDRVIIIIDRTEDKNVGGIILPGQFQERPNKGTVLAVGPGILNDKGKRVPMDTKPGDRVLFGKYSGSVLSDEGEQEVIMMGEADILGIITEE